MDRGTCRSCGASVLWVETINGKRIPLDAEPVGDGNILMNEGKAVVMGKGLAEQSKRLSVPLYRSHFATCPNANQHRMKK